jgi:small conductance mechanosensitive channel
LGKEFDRRLEDFWRANIGPVLDYSGRVLGALLILAVGWLANRFLMTPLRQLLTRSRFDPSVASFLANSLRTVLLVVVILGILQQLGVQTASLLTLLGVTGLAVALSLQNALANFASGLIVLSFRMMRVGDLVETGDIRGRVVEMLPFHVVIVTVDNQRVTVPNTILTNAPLRNHSALPLRRVQWTLPLAARLGDLDLAAAKAALRTQLQADARIRSEPAPHLYVQEWTDEKRVLVIAAWTATEDYTAVQEDLLEALGLRLEEIRRETKV